MFWLWILFKCIIHVFLDFCQMGINSFLKRQTVQCATYYLLLNRKFKPIWNKNRFSVQLSNLTTWIDQLAATVTILPMYITKRQVRCRKLSSCFDKQLEFSRTQARFQGTTYYQTLPQWTTQHAIQHSVCTLVITSTVKLPLPNTWLGLSSWQGYFPEDYNFLTMSDLYRKGARSLGLPVWLSQSDWFHCSRVWQSISKGYTVDTKKQVPNHSWSNQSTRLYSTNKIYKHPLYM